MSSLIRDMDPDPSFPPHLQPLTRLALPTFTQFDPRPADWLPRPLAGSVRSPPPGRLRSDEASYFRLKAFGPETRDYYGASVSVPSAAGPLSVFVARLAEGNLLAHALLREFIVDAAWLIPLFM